MSGCLQDKWVGSADLQDSHVTRAILQAVGFGQLLLQLHAHPIHQDASTEHALGLVGRGSEGPGTEGLIS